MLTGPGAVPVDSTGSPQLVDSAEWTGTVSLNHERGTQVESADGPAELPARFNRVRRTS